MINERNHRSLIRHGHTSATNIQATYPYHSLLNIRWGDSFVEKIQPQFRIEPIVKPDTMV